MFTVLIAIALAGGIGGVANALIAENGLITPQSVATGGGTIWRPGWIGNAVIGSIAAVVSWGLYGPYSGSIALGAGASAVKNSASEVGVTYAALAGAALIGVGGAKWLTDQVDKKLLRAAAVDAAKGQASPNLANQIAQASPAQAMQLARDFRP